MVASTCRRGDVMVLLSFTGLTRATVEVTQIARQAGVVTIAITKADLPLTHIASMTLAFSMHRKMPISICLCSHV